MTVADLCILAAAVCIAFAAGNTFGPAVGALVLAVELLGLSWLFADTPDGEA